jgi:hypothetical protein
VAVADGPLTNAQTVGPQRIATILKARTAEKWRRVGGCLLTVTGDCTAVAGNFCNPVDRDSCEQPIVSTALRLSPLFADSLRPMLVLSLCLPVSHPLSLSLCCRNVSKSMASTSALASAIARKMVATC